MRTYKTFLFLLAALALFHGLAWGGGRRPVSSSTDASPIIHELKGMVKDARAFEGSKFIVLENLAATIKVTRATVFSVSGDGPVLYNYENVLKTIKKMPVLVIAAEDPQSREFVAKQIKILSPSDQAQMEIDKQLKARKTEGSKESLDPYGRR